MITLTDENGSKVLIIVNNIFYIKDTSFKFETYKSIIKSTSDCIHVRETVEEIEEKIKSLNKN